MPSGMRGALLILALALSVAAVAEAQPPSGISRPSDEKQLKDAELGAQLYAGNCASCHGVAGQGVNGSNSTRDTGNVRGRGPSLRGVGAQAADFYLRTGYMPLRDPEEQPWRRRVLFTKRELSSLVKYVASLGGGPPLPRVAVPEGGASLVVKVRRVAGRRPADPAAGTRARAPRRGSAPLHPALRGL